MLYNDIRYGLRTLAANPGFTAIAILSLAIGIGANTSIFSLADAMLLRPLPVEHSSQVVRVLSTSPSIRHGAISYRDYVDFRDQAKTLSGLIAYQQIPVAMNPDPRSPAQLKLGLAVSPNYFDVLGVRPSLGRGFRPDENRTPVVVLSNSTWESQFGRDAAVIGRTVSISKVDFTVIGVAPKNFPGLERYVHEAIYVPIEVLPRLSPEGKNPNDQRDRLNLTVYGRLVEGRTATEAQSELQTIAKNLERAYPETNRGRTALVMNEVRARMTLDPTDAIQTAILLTLAGLVLMIACANVASLLLSRARGRAREIAIRIAIGAGRARLLRQLLTESMLLAVAGGGVGLVLALFSINFLSSLRLPTDLPAWIVVHLDLRVLAFCIGASVLSGIIFGLAPALHTLRQDLSTTLKAGDAASSGKRYRFQIRNLLVVGQVAVSLILLVASGLLVKDFRTALRFNPGFRTDHVLLMMLNPALARYQEAQARAFYRELIHRLQALPGVRSVSLAQHIPLGFTSSNPNVIVEGFEMAPNQRSLSVGANTVDENYFATMQIPLAAGRAFDIRDSASSIPVAIVNETMARQYWPKGSAIGGRIQLDNRTLEVIGVAKDIKYNDLAERPQPFLYLPFSQQYRSGMMLHVETAGDPAVLAAPVLAEIRRIDPGQPVQEIQTLHHFFEEGALFGSRLITRLVTVIGLFGALLATVGLYGVVAYSVSRRTREIGIRMALGAHPGKVARLVLRQGMILTSAGVAIGVVLSLLASQALQSQLVGVSARDPLVYIAIPCLLAIISLLACYVPARRAARVDPLRALRQE